MATRMEEILMTGNQLEYCKALDNYVLNRSERLPLPIGMVFSPKYFQHLKGLVWLGVEVPFQTRKTAPPSTHNKTQDRFHSVTPVFERCYHPVKSQIFGNSTPIYICSVYAWGKGPSGCILEWVAKSRSVLMFILLWSYSERPKDLFIGGLTHNHEKKSTRSNKVYNLPSVHDPSWNYTN